jgi:hypothetical protein
MNFRLKRIQTLVLLVTTASALFAAWSGLSLPTGIVIGGFAAWLDFVVIKELASAMLVRRPSAAHIVPMALAKSLVLVAVPAVALLLPTSSIDGVSFAIGVTALPVAVVIDACIEVPEIETGEV